jgi:hypothetical protein
MSVVDLEGDFDRRAAGRETRRRASAAPGCANCTPVQRLIEIHRVDDDELVVPGIAARRPARETGIFTPARSRTSMYDLGARLLRFAFDQALDELRLRVDPQFERAAAVGRDPDHVEVGAVRAGAFLVRDARRTRGPDTRTRAGRGYAALTASSRAASAVSTCDWPDASCDQATLPSNPAAPVTGPML